MDPENLRAVPLFASMADADLNRIATFATEDSAAEGATLVREGDFSNDMVAIESGTAEVLRGGETVGSPARASATSASPSRTSIASAVPATPSGRSSGGGSRSVTSAGPSPVSAPTIPHE